MTISKRIAPVLIVLIVAELAARLWVAAVDPVQVDWYDASAQIRIEALEAGQEAEVAFVGTSMAWQGFVPSVFTEADPQQRSAYNLGLDGGIPQVIAPWLTDQVVPRTDSQMVVWGLSSLDLSPTFGQAARDRYDAAFETRPGFVGAVDRGTASLSALVQWRRVLRDPSLWRSSSERDDLADITASIGSGGERRDFEPNKIDQRRQILRTRLEADAADLRDVEAFTDAVEELIAQGIDVVIVLMPVPPTFVDAHPDGRVDFEARLAFLEKMATDAGARVLDFSGDFGEADFVDFTHLSEAAAQRFTTIFAQALNTDSAEPGTSAGECETVMVEDDFGFLVPEEQC